MPSWRLRTGGWFARSRRRRSPARDSASGRCPAEHAASPRFARFGRRAGCFCSCRISCSTGAATRSRPPISFKAILFTAAVVALLISTAKSRRFRMAAIAFLVLNQIIWTGYVVYFGQALSPEHLLLVQHEATDTVLGVLDDWRSLLPWAPHLAGGRRAIRACNGARAPIAQWRWRVSGVSFVDPPRRGDGVVDAASADRRRLPRQAHRRDVRSVSGGGRRGAHGPDPGRRERV